MAAPLVTHVDRVPLHWTEAEAMHLLYDPDWTARSFAQSPSFAGIDEARDAFRVSHHPGQLWERVEESGL